MQRDVKNQLVRKIVETAIIAALYVVLTFISNIFGLSYSGVQLRLSEALTILPALSPFAVTGLTIGCFISNLASPLGIIDIVFGTLSTFICAQLTRMCSKVIVKGIPILAPLPPVLVGSILIGLMIAFIMPEGFSFYAFLISSISVGIGEFIVCYGLGIPLFLFIKKSKILK